MQNSVKWAFGNENYDSNESDNFNDDADVKNVLGFFNYLINPEHVSFVIDINRIKIRKHFEVRKYYSQVDFTRPLLKGCRKMNNQRIIISVFKKLLNRSEICKRNQMFTETVQLNWNFWWTYAFVCIYFRISVVSFITWWQML